MSRGISLLRIIQVISVFFVALLFVIPLYLYNDQILGPIEAKFELPKPNDIYSKFAATVFPRTDEILAVNDDPVLFDANKSQPEKEDNKAVPYFSISDHNARLIIKSINVDGPVVSGTTEKAMNKGFWHYPTSAASFSYGNTVLIGHRYLRLPPNKNTFYNLDKVQVGDEIQIQTDSGTLDYIVSEKRVVEVTDTSVLDHTDTPTLTLITCHPLWTSRQRLVIISRLVRSTINL